MWYTHLPRSEFYSLFLVCTNHASQALQRLDEAHETIAALQQQLQACEDELRKRSTQLRTAQRTAAKERDELKVQRRRLLLDQDALEAQVCAASEEIANLQSMAAELEKDAERKNRRIQEMDHTLAGYKNELPALREENRSIYQSLAWPLFSNS